MVKLENIFFMVVASYDQPVYKYMIQMRRKQFQQQGVDYIFVLDGPQPEIIEEDEVYYFRTPRMEETAGPDLEKRISGMLRKFQAACKDYIDAKPTKHTHVLRLNVSTFVNFSVLETMLENAPETHCYAGTWRFEEPWIFLSGTAILMSHDVVQYLVRLNLDEYIVAHLKPDDVALGKLLERFDAQDLFPMILMPDDWSKIDEHPFIRVRNEGNDRKIEDAKHWRDLMARYEGIESDSFIPEEVPSLKIWFLASLVTLAIIFAVLPLFINVRH